MVGVLSPAVIVRLMRAVEMLKVRGNKKRLIKYIEEKIRSGELCGGIADEIVRRIEEYPYRCFDKVLMLLRGVLFNYARPIVDNIDEVEEILGAEIVRITVLVHEDSDRLVVSLWTQGAAEKDETRKIMERFYGDERKKYVDIALIPTDF